MKRLTAVIAAALIMLSVSVPVFAEPDDDTASQTAVQNSEDNAEENNSDDNNTSQESADEENTDESETAQESADEDNTDESNTAQESADEDNTAQSSAAQNSGEQNVSGEASGEQNSQVKMTEYRIDDADMNISVPSDMYVITRNTDPDDPVLALNRTDKEKVMKEFQENDIFLRANARDFSWVVTVMESESEDTGTIGSLSSLSDKNLQNIIDKLLESDIYTGCAKNRYGGVLFLTFTIEYKSGDTVISGIQQYTIINGKNVKITYQTSADSETDPNKHQLAAIMDTVRFDGIAAESSQPETSHSLSVTDIDIRYIYIIAASIIGVVALMIMIIAGIKYKKSKKKALQLSKEKKKAETEKENAEAVETDDDIHEPVTVKDLELFTENKDDDGFKPAPMSYKDISEQEPAKPMSYRDIDTAAPDVKLEDTAVIDLPDFDSGNTDISNAAVSIADDEKIVKTAADMQNEKDENGEEIVFARADEKRRTEIEQVSDSKDGTEDKKPDEKPDTAADEKKADTDTVKPVSAYEKHFGKPEPVPAQKSEPAADTKTVTNEPAEEKTQSGKDNSFFNQMIDKLRTTSEEVSSKINKENKEKGTQLLPDADKETNADMTENSEKLTETITENDADTGKKSNTIELEISKSADGSLVIGALNEQSGKPLDIEIRDASNFKDDRDRKMSQLGFETARDNEIYNAHRAENEEKPFVVRAKAEEENPGEKESLTPETEEEFFEGVKAVKEAVKPAVKEKNEEQEKKKSEFELESGISFEYPLPKQTPIIPMQSVFTAIPRLDSVNAEEYNARYDEIKKTMPKNHAYAQRFSHANIPQPFVETAKPHKTEKPEENAVGQEEQNGAFEYYAGYEQAEGDPFGAGENEEMIIKAHNRKKPGGSFGSMLKKIFSPEAPEDED